MAVNFLEDQRDFVRGSSWEIELRSLCPRDLTKGIYANVCVPKGTVTEPWKCTGTDLLRLRFVAFELHLVVASVPAEAELGTMMSLKT